MKVNYRIGSLEIYKLAPALNSYVNYRIGSLENRTFSSLIAVRIGHNNQFDSPVLLAFTIYGIININ